MIDLAEFINRLGDDLGRGKAETSLTLDDGRNSIHQKT